MKGLKNCRIFDSVFMEISGSIDINFRGHWWKNHVHTKPPIKNKTHFYYKALPFSLLICIFERIVCKCGFVPCVFHHVVPCDQSLSYGCPSGFKTLRGEKHKIPLMLFILQLKQESSNMIKVMDSFHYEA